jgi:dTDP-4-dehydrorhamnose 3,5-epimerase
MHALRNYEESFNGFGEAYFSSVKKDMAKGWKMHKEMTLNLIVPVGNIRFIILNKNTNNKSIVSPLIDVTLGENNYSRLTVPPEYWVAFKGVETETNILLNIADIPHDPNESDNKDLNYFKVESFL